MKKEEILKEFRQKFASAYLIADEAVIDTFLRAVESWWLLKLSENTAELKKKIEGKRNILKVTDSPSVEEEATSYVFNKGIEAALAELNHQ